MESSTTCFTMVMIIAKTYRKKTFCLKQKRHMANKCDALYVWRMEGGKRIKWGLKKAFVATGN